MGNGKVIAIITIFISILIITIFQEALAEEPSGETWESLSPMPTPRTEVVAVPVGEKIYVIGGFDKEGRGTNTVEVFDTKNNSWNYVSTIPERLHHVGAAAHNQEIYVVGGYKNGWNPSDSLFIYNIITDTWRVGPSLPTARGALTAQFVGDTLYAVGGANLIALSVNEAFDTRTNSWQTKAPMPTAREHLSSAVIEEKLYVIGGRVMTMAMNLGANEVYDPQTNTWEILEDMHTPRGGLTSSAIGGTIFVFGGEETFGTFDQNEQYIPNQGWQTRTPMPTARHGLGSATVNDKIYVIGGGAVPGLSVSGVNESYYNINFIPEFISAEKTPPPLYHFNKGTVDESSAFAGEVIWTLLNGDKGAIVHSSDHGVVVVRLDLSPSDVCIKSDGAFCLDGVVTSFKNTVSHNVGEDVKFIVDLATKQETISMINGPLAGTDVIINLSKIRMPEP